MFEMDGQLLSVVSVEHIKLARAGAVIKAKLRNLLTGSIFEQSFRSGDKYKTVRIEKREAPLTCFVTRTSSSAWSCPSTSSSR